jgi:hypothetical protein
MQVSSYATSDANSMSTFIPFNDGELLQQLAENEEDINMLFMSNETVIFKNGKGINREVTYLGPTLPTEY